MAVTTQPRGKRQEIESFVRDLDPLTVQGRPASVHAWTSSRVPAEHSRPLPTSSP